MHSTTTSFSTKFCTVSINPASGTFHPEAWYFPKNGPQPYQQDLDKAEDLLDAAGWVDSDGDGIRDKEINGRRVPFRFTMLTYQTETGVQAATLMKECLDKIGIVCNVKPTEFTVLVDTTQKKNFDAAMGGWGAGTDPDLSSNLYATGEGRNYVSFSNKRVDELFQQGPPRVRPRKTGRYLRRNRQHPLGRTALNVALLPQCLFRLQQGSPRLQLLPARPLQF